MEAREDDNRFSSASPTTPSSTKISGDEISSPACLEGKSCSQPEATPPTEPRLTGYSFRDRHEITEAECLKTSEATKSVVKYRRNRSGSDSTCKPGLDLPSAEHPESLAREFSVTSPIGSLEAELGDLRVIPRLSFTPATPGEPLSSTVAEQVDLTDYLPPFDSPPTVPSPQLLAPPIPGQKQPTRRRTWSAGDSLLPSMFEPETAEDRSNRLERAWEIQSASLEETVRRISERFGFPLLSRLAPREQPIVASERSWTPERRSSHTPSKPRTLPPLKRSVSHQFLGANAIDDEDVFIEDFKVFRASRPAPSPPASPSSNNPVLSLDSPSWLMTVDSRYDATTAQSQAGPSDSTPSKLKRKISSILLRSTSNSARNGPDATGTANKGKEKEKDKEKDKGKGKRIRFAPQRFSVSSGISNTSQVSETDSTPNASSAMSFGELLESVAVAFERFTRSLHGNGDDEN